MLDGNDDGLGRRKLVQRTVAERAAIVAETYAPGATVAGVAARRGMIRGEQGMTDYSAHCTAKLRETSPATYSVWNIGVHLNVRVFQQTEDNASRNNFKPP